GEIAAYGRLRDLAPDAATGDGLHLRFSPEVDEQPGEVDQPRVVQRAVLVLEREDLVDKRPHLGRPALFEENARPPRDLRADRLGIPGHVAELERARPRGLRRWIGAGAHNRGLQPGELMLE